MTSRESTIAEKFRAKFDAFIQEHKNDKLSKEDEELLRDPARRRFIKHVTELEFAKRGISLHPTQPTTKTLFLLNKFFNIKGDDHYSKPELEDDVDFFGKSIYEDASESQEEIIKKELEDAEEERNKIKTKIEEAKNKNNLDKLKIRLKEIEDKEKKNRAALEEREKARDESFFTKGFRRLGNFIGFSQPDENTVYYSIEASFAPYTDWTKS